MSYSPRSSSPEPLGPAVNSHHQYGSTTSTAEFQHLGDSHNATVGKKSITHCGDGSRGENIFNITLGERILQRVTTSDERIRKAQEAIDRIVAVQKLLFCVVSFHVLTTVLVTATIILHYQPPAL